MTAHFTTHRFFAWLLCVGAAETSLDLTKRDEEPSFSYASILGSVDPPRIAPRARAHVTCEHT